MFKTGAITGAGIGSGIKIPFKNRKGFFLVILSLSAIFYYSVHDSVRSFIWREDLIWIEAEDFRFKDDLWVHMEDLNFSNYMGIMSARKDEPAYAEFTVPEEDTYTIWVRFFGNYGDIDLKSWNRHYTNTYRYIDYFGATDPLDMAVAIDDLPPQKVLQEGPHRYRWVRVGSEKLSKGAHTIAVWKSGDSPGAVTLDTVLVSNDPAYRPHRIEFIPRTVSRYLGPLIIGAFPLAVLVLGERVRDRKRGMAVYYVTSGLLAGFLSIMWIDTDGGFWIWLSQNRAFTMDSIYSQGDALHHRYVYQPTVALLFVSLRKVLELFSAMDGLTPRAILLGKLIVLPFVFLTACLLSRTEGRQAALVWLLNSLVIFAVAAHTMYFALAFLFTMSLYFAKRENHHLSALSLGLAGAFMNITMLLFPAYLLLLRPLGLRRMLYMTGLFLLPGFLVLLPYRILDPSGLEARVMSAGIATWMKMHTGIKLGPLGLTPLLLTVLLAYIWLRRPPLTYMTMATAFAAVSLVYLNIGAPYFLFWTVAFQPFIIVWAVRYGQVHLYALYVTALMVWGSFYTNTEGAYDRAGETGFYPYHNFYSWPFDAYRLIESIYPGIRFFERGDIEVVAHSLAAGISTVLCVLVIYHSFHNVREARTGL